MPVDILVNAEMGGGDLRKGLVLKSPDALRPGLQVEFRRRHRQVNVPGPREADAADIAGLERMGEKSAANLVAAIAESRQRPLERLIYALGIRHVGEHAAWLLAERYGSIEKLSRATVEELTGIHGVGEVMAESIYRFFKNAENQKVLRKLKDAGVTMSQEKPRRGLKGKLL